MDAGGLVTRAPNLPTPAPLEPLIDQTRRVWTPCDGIYRFHWALLYRDGTLREQYEQRGETIFQTYFGKIQKIGVARILILDFDHPDFLFAIEVPEDATADILYNCRTTDFVRTERIFTFGFTRPPPAAPEYLHIDPRTEPPRMWWAPDRIV
jgi:hypothetical protein